MPIIIWQLKRMLAKIPEFDEAKDLSGTHQSGTDEEMKILFLGESAVAGVGIESNNDALAGQLSGLISETRKIDIKWDVLAISGYRCADVRSQLVPQIEKNYDVVFIQLGGNDSFKLTSPRTWRKELEWLINELKRKEAGKKYVFINLPPVRTFAAFPKLIRFFMGNQVDLLSAVLHEYSEKEADVYFLKEKFSISQLNEDYPDRPLDDFYADGVHPSALSHRIWAEKIYTEIVDRDLLG